MPEVTRTVRQWRALARRAEAADPALAVRIRATLADVAWVHPDEPLDRAPITVEVAAAEAAALVRLVPGKPAALAAD